MKKKITNKDNKIIKCSNIKSLKIKVLLNDMLEYTINLGNKGGKNAK